MRQGRPILKIEEKENPPIEMSTKNKSFTKEEIKPSFPQKEEEKRLSF